LTAENRHLSATFDSERLRLEKMHLAEVSRLHKAVKTMHKRAKAMPALERQLWKGETPGGQTNEY